MIVSPLLVSTLLAAATWFSTGTVIVEIEGSPVQPVAIRLAGPAEGEWPLDGRSRVVLAGLAPGEYAVTPVFAGKTTPFNPKVEVRAATLATLHVPTAAYGGVRFDADPGMCEPDDPWKAALVSLRPAAGEGQGLQRVLTNVPAATEHCVRSLGGLLPGSYTFQVTPPERRMPPYTFTFRIEPGKWLTRRLPAPSVVARGTVTYGGEPAAGVDVRFLSPAPPVAPPRAGNPGTLPVEPTTLTVGFSTDGPRTDEAGGFVMALLTPGTYVPAAADSAGALLVQQPIGEVQLQAGVNAIDIVIGGGRLFVDFIRLDRHVGRSIAATVVAQHARGTARTMGTSDVMEPLRIDALPPGAYSVSATASTTSEEGTPVTLVASSVQVVFIEDAEARRVTIELVERPATLEVVNAEGTPIESATLLSTPVLAPIKTDASGRASIDQLAVGTRVAIRSRTWDMTCHVVTGQAVQRVVVAAATEPVLLTWQDAAGPTRPPAQLGLSPGSRVGPFGGATIAGVPGATCPIPLSAFSLATVRLPRPGLLINLPPGAYTITLADGREFSFTAPGRLEVK